MLYVMCVPIKIESSNFLMVWHRWASYNLIIYLRGTCEISNAEHDVTASENWQTMRHTWPRCKHVATVHAQQDMHRNRQQESRQNRTVRIGQHLALELFNDRAHGSEKFARNDHGRSLPDDSESMAARKQTRAIRKSCDHKLRLLCPRPWFACSKHMFRTSSSLDLDQETFTQNALHHFIITQEHNVCYDTTQYTTTTVEFRIVATARWSNSLQRLTAGS